MDKAVIAVMTDRLREAFVAAGADLQERRTVSGHAFLVAGRAIGQFEERSGGLRVRLWLAEKERATFEKRPTFDRESGWLYVVSDEDVTFVSELAPAAYKAAASGKASPPSARAVEVPAAEGTSALDEQKKSASRRISANSRRPAGRG